MHQKRLWFLQNLDPDGLPFVVALRGKLSAAIDHKRLTDCLDQLLQKHETLHMVIRDVEGTPEAHIMPFSAADMFSIHPSADPQTLQHLLEKPFRIGVEPLLRVALLASSELLIVAHQLLLDRQALLQFLKSLVVLYNGEALPAYPDTVQLESTDSAAVDQIAWWQQQLQGAPILEFPIDYQRPPIQSVKRAYYEFTFSDKSGSMLEAFAQKHQSKPQDVLSALLATLLYRYTSADDLLFGLVKRNQPIKEVEQALGSLENVVPIRLGLKDGLQFADLLSSVQTVTEESSARYVPYGQVLDALNVARDISRSPLVQIVFSYHDTLPAELQLGDASLSLTLPFEPAHAFDLRLDCWKIGDELHGRLEYDSALFAESTIPRIAGYLQTLFTSVLETPKSKLIDLPIMSEAEKEHVLTAWNHTRVAFPETNCVHQLIEEQVRRTPQRIAATAGEDRITFEELNRRANQVAHYLLSLEIEPDNLVGIHLERSIDMLVAVLGVMKAGAGYVPLDPNFPPERLSLIVEDSKIKVLISHTALHDRMPQHNAHLIHIDTNRELLEQQPTENPVTTVQAHNLVYVIFTSGSTGRPKGVQLEHRSVVNFLLSMQKEPGLTADDVMLAVTTLSFDIAVLELYLPLITGAQVVIASYEDTLDGRRLLDLMTQHSATVMQATPATWQLLLEIGWKGSPNLKALCGGEALPLILAKEIIQRTSALWNMYGPTETTVWSTVQHIQEAGGLIPIGHPIDNTTIYILDPAGNPTPLGVPGELTIGGDGLARGYFERPDLTAEKFLPDPFAGKAGARMYRTGDIARYLPDGRLQFYGRVDHQVKVRGFRIELGEIETMLDRHPSIKQSVVVVQPDFKGEKQLVAYLVTQDDFAVSVSELRKYLKDHLPQYMIPNVFATLDQLPLTPNGKINRLALPKADMSESVEEKEQIAPRNEIEVRLVKIWSDALGHPNIGVTENFFELGGHSLLAIRIFTRIEKEFGKNLPLATLFTAPTIAQFAELLGDNAQQAVGTLHPAIVPIQTKGTKTPFFCVGGGVINLNHVATKLGPDQPFYGLQWQGIDVEMVMKGTLTDIAGAFIDAVKTIQPLGPYYLAGSFTAGMVAVEMGRLLEERGEKVAFLAGFDAVIMDNTSMTVHPEVKARKKRKTLPQKVIGLLKRGPGPIWEFISNPIQRERFWHLVWKLSVRYFIGTGKSIPTWLRTARFEEYFILHVTMRHIPQKKYQGKFELFLTPTNFSHYETLPNFGWHDWVEGEVHANKTPGVPCTIMLPPYVQELTTLLKDRMSQQS